MTTRLTPERPVRRAIDTARHGPLVVILTVEGVYYREKGRRTAFLLPHGVAFQQAVGLHVARERAEKKMAKAAKKRRK